MPELFKHASARGLGWRFYYENQVIALVFALTLACGLCLSPQVRAQSVTDGVLINADEMDRDMGRGLVRLKGHVQVVFQGQHLSCERAELNLKKQSLRAEGHVILSNERAHVEGDLIVFNYKQNTGFIYNGFVQSGQVVFEGDMIEKVADAHYIASHAEYTACDTCPPAWSFSGRTIDAEIGGYARIKRPVFKIGGIPILILPSLIVPLKSARQSGFLVPTMDYSNKAGFAVGESYFWAIDRSQDLTFTAKRYSLRGNKLREEYRYVLGENSLGHLNSSWIPDRTFRNDNSLSQTMDRWLVDYSHHFEMPDNYVHRAEIKLPSDLRYIRDFPDEMPGHGDSALESRMSITKSGDYSYASGEVGLYRSLLKTNPLAPNDDAVNRTPELKFSLKESQLFEHGPYFALDLDYVNFSRDRYNYDDMVTDDSGKRTPRGLGTAGEVLHDGSFDPYYHNPSGTRFLRDMNRTGQRLDLRPTITYPFQIARKFDVLPILSFRETQYRFYLDDPSFAPTAARRYLQEDLRVKTEFSRVFGADDSPQATRLKHSIEPEIGYSTIPWMRRPNHPFFGEFRHVQYSRQYSFIADSDLSDPNTGVQFDYEDRTIERRVVDFVLTNRLTRKIWSNGNPDYQTIGLFRLWQAYDFTALPFAWSSLNALLDMRFQNFETNTTAEYNGYAKVFNTNSRVRVMTSPQDFLQVSYTKYTSYTSTYEKEPGETRNIAFGAGFLSQYVEASGQIDWALTTNQLQAWQYDLRVRPPGRCWVFKVIHRQIIGGERQIHFAANFEFGGSNLSPTPTDRH